MKRILAALTVLALLICANTAVSRLFDFEKDRSLAVDTATISKTIDDKETNIIKVFLFMENILQEKGLNIPKSNSRSFGFIIVKVINTDYFTNLSKDTFVLEYDYTPLKGTLKSEEKVVESYVNFHHDGQDFGGRSYCADCGEPLAYGVRHISIDNDDPIWLKNNWLDLSKDFFLDLRWLCEEETLEFKFQKE